MMMGARNVVGIAEARAELAAGAEIMVYRGLKSSATLCRPDGSHSTLIFPAFVNLFDAGEIEERPSKILSTIHYYRRRDRP